MIKSCRIEDTKCKKHSVFFLVLFLLQTFSSLAWALPEDPLTPEQVAKNALLSAATQDQLPNLATLPGGSVIVADSLEPPLEMHIFPRIQLPWRVASSADNDVSLVVQASEDRLPRVIEQCRRYNGPLSITVFIANFQNSSSSTSSSSDVQSSKAGPATEPGTSASSEENPFVVISNEQYHHHQEDNDNAVNMQDSDPSEMEEPSQTIKPPSSHQSIRIDSELLNSVNLEEATDEMFVDLDDDYFAEDYLRFSEGSSDPDIVDAAQQLRNRLHSFLSDPCISEHAVVHVIAANENFDACRYPVQQLRNLALRGSSTDLVFIVDADFIPSFAHQTLKAQTSQERQILTSPGVRAALVVPAFESTSRFEDGKDTVPSSMEECLQALLDGKIEPFRHKKCASCHRPTNFKRWIRPENTQTYGIQYSPDFEPYIIANRQVLPDFPERFIGYGRNKIAFFQAMHSAGFVLAVLPQLFVVHVEHTYRFENASIRMACRDRNIALYSQFLREIKSFTGHSCSAGEIFPFESWEDVQDKWIDQHHASAAIASPSSTPIGSDSYSLFWRSPGKGSKKSKIEPASSALPEAEL